MTQKLTHEEIESLHHLCQSILDQKIFGTPETLGARRLDAETLLIELAWKALVPILVSVTGSLTSEAIKRRVFKGKDSKNAELQARDTVGKTKAPLSDEGFRLCVLSIEEIIGEYGGTKEQAEQITRTLLRELNPDK